MQELDTATYYTQIIVTIEFWEWVALFSLFFLGYLYVSRQKLVLEERQPEYKYFVWGYHAKILGALSFVLVYFYYYQGGDTLRYFESGVAMANLFYKDPGAYLEVMMSSNTDEARSNFDFFTGMPYIYIYKDMKTYFVVKLISPLIIITNKSYLLTSALIGFITYLCNWKLYQLFYRLYPEVKYGLALCTLFIPSMLFWGSGVSKDSFTLAATCLFTYHIYKFTLGKKRSLTGVIAMLICIYIILGIKPYIFMILFPGVLFWIFYHYLQNMENKKLSLILFPLAIIFTIGFSYAFLKVISNSDDKFSIDNAMETASITQQDLKQDYYQGKSFDIGDNDGTTSAAIRLMPNAILAGMIRPFIWEANSPFMLLSALENLIIIFLIIRLFVKGGIIKPIRNLFSIPLLLFCFIFSILFAYMLGLTTSNFGALMRFKIPMLPFLFSGLLISNYFFTKRYKSKFKQFRI